MSFKMKRLQNLISERDSALSSDIEWNDGGRDAQKSLDRIQDEILATPITDAPTFMLMAKILVSGDDDPNFADEFKDSLFEKLRGASAAVL